MLIIELAFPGGRYHATPWGRHVNEGAVEWPPSPYRLARGLFDAWKRKRPGWSEGRVRPLLEALASEAPRFVIPPATVSHTRSYLSANQKDPSKRTLIFDAFVAVPVRNPVLAGWPNVSLEPEAEADLDELLGLLNYLGRSESWVAARVLRGVRDAEWNCSPYPASSPGDTIPVACLAPPDGFSMGGQPRDWLDGLAFSTRDLIKERVSDPPALQWVDYVRARDCFSPVRGKPVSARRSIVQGVLYALDGKLLPLATKTVELAEQIRVRLMGIHKVVAGGPERVSERFSGKDREGKPLRGHRHAFVWPLDQDRDGRLDHVLVYCREPFTQDEELALDRLDWLWQAGGRPELRAVPVLWGTEADFMKASTRIESATPFVPNRHWRKGRGTYAEWLVGEVVQECRHMGMDAPTRIHPLRDCPVRGRRPWQWLEFRRSRKGEGAEPGFGFVLEFEHAVAAPLALGYGAHFGLGLFRPSD